MMKYIKSSIFVASFFLSCTEKKLDAKNSNSENVQKTDSITGAKKENISSQNNEMDGFENVLQGKWQRTSYPYGTVEFTDNTIKIEAGEGGTKAAEFKKFTLSDTCSSSKVDHSSYEDYLLIDGEKDCTVIKIDKDALWLTFSGTSEKIIYTRIQNEIPVDQFISQNIQGVWVLDQKNCGTKNKDEITISNKAVKYSDKNLELKDITEYEPTRIVADFNSENNKKTKGKIILSMDLQSNGTVLIVREYGDNARPGVFQYFKCK